MILVKRTAEGFRATTRALRYLDGSNGVSFHTLSLLEDRCVRLLVKNLGRHMPENVVREELENLGICIKGVLHLRSVRRDQEAAKARPLTPLLCITSAGAGRREGAFPDRTLRLRVTVETYVAPKDPCSASGQRFGHTQGYWATHPSVLLVVRLTSQRSVPPHNSSLSAAPVEETTQQTTGATRNGRSPRRRLQRGRL